ncbi:MAG TPA: hypothetical protein VGS12_01690 [Caulobacteraceae bacterium]|nr:hypothetical protein [Caulobacteraceae bacterium]
MTTLALVIAPTTAIIIALVVVALVIAAVLIARRQSSHRLRSRFGPEYARAVETTGDKQKAEAELRDRAKRVQKFDIRPLSAPDRDRFFAAWRRVQAQFVDNPRDAVTRADQLLGEAMSARGYPVSDFEAQAADLSVDHPMVVQEYRAGHDIAARHGEGQTSTEDLRQAMVHYRVLFDDLVGEPEHIETAEAPRRAAQR